MNFINKINKYLIERFPTIWNTKIVWILFICLPIHGLFFLIGYFSHTNPQTFHYGYTAGDYFNSGMILVHIIISLLMITGWLVAMFKNNAFKNFYPVSRTQLFGQFLCYFIIIFCSVSFYFSYMFGFKLFITKEYPDDLMIKNVAIINKANAFLSTDYQPYQLSQRKYPQIFEELHCETNSDYIDYSKNHYAIRNEVYQFYSLYQKAVTQKNEYNEFLYPEEEQKKNIDFVRYQVRNDTCFYFYRKEVVNVSEYVKNAELSYYNFSRPFYTLSSGTSSNRYDSYYYNETYYPPQNDAQLNQQIIELLDRNNPEEIKQILDDFLNISKQLKIKTNLNTNDWFKIVYHPDNFEVKQFIYNNFNFDLNPSYYPYDAEAVVEAATANASDAVIAEETVSRNSTYYFFKNNHTNYFYETGTLKNTLLNIDSMKNYDFISQNIHIYLWLSFILSALIFSFRVTNLRTVIFTGITTGVLSLLVGLISLMYSLSVSSYNVEYFTSYFILALGFSILSIPIFMPKSGSKLFRGILINMSILGFVPYVFLILGIITMHQKDACREVYNYSDCFILLQWLDSTTTSWILLTTGFIFLLIYTSIIKKWRALPE